MRTKTSLFRGRGLRALKARPSGNERGLLAPGRSCRCRHRPFGMPIWPTFESHEVGRMGTAFQPETGWWNQG